jgi:hypothetical protein
MGREGKRLIQLMLLQLVSLSAGETTSELWAACARGDGDAAACAPEHMGGWVPAASAEWQGDVSTWYSDTMAALELMNRRGWQAVCCVCMLLHLDFVCARLAVPHSRY